jgi:hypothetical protein
MFRYVGQRFLRDPIQRFHSCIVRSRVPISDQFGTEANGDSRFAFPLISQIAESHCKIAAKGDALVFALRNCPQLLAEAIEQESEFGEYAAGDRTSDYHLLESGKSKRYSNEILPSMIVQIARYPAALLLDSVLNCGGG